ncbi:MAG TPA: alpha/beta hydrolase, partial [Asanoa sp.]|nr:alpha/beta hydrolase [Asanoa sp.]
MKTAIRLAAAAAVASLAVGVVGVPNALAADNPYERGPAPTTSILDASRGPFATSQTTVSSAVSGFGGGIIYYPTSTSEGTFGGIAISPGYTAAWSSISWLGPRLASHGFVVIGIETNSRFDQPASRGTQLLAALDYLVNSSSVRTRVDSTRLAVAGHSMGGGGTLEAASDRPSLQAAIPLAPWNTDKSWTELRVPTLIIGGESDTVAPVSSHSIPFYNSIPASAEKAYLELNNASHFFPQSVNTPTGRQMVAWLKRFVDNDTRY